MSTTSLTVPIACIAAFGGLLVGWSVSQPSGALNNPVIFSRPQGDLDGTGPLVINEEAVTRFRVASNWQMPDEMHNPALRLMARQFAIAVVDGMPAEEVH